MLHKNFFKEMALHYTFKKITDFVIIQKNHFCTLTYVISCAFQTQPILTFQNQLNMQIPTLLLILMSLHLTKSHHTTTLFHIHYHQLYIITTLQIFSQVTAQILKYMTTYLSKSYLKPIKLTHLLTDHANYLKTNLFYLTLQ